VSLQNFIPEIWSTQVLEALPAVLVFASLCNTDYEGDISKMGDTVRISGIGDITVSSYVKDTTIGSPQALADAQTALTISQAKFFNFAIDDVDKAQGNPAVMGAAMRWAAYSLAKQADLFVAGLYTDIPAANSIGSSGSPTTLARATNANIAAGTTLYDELVVLAQLLTQNNVPNDGDRFVVLPAWGKTLLTQDYRFTAFNTPSADNTIQTGALTNPGGAPPAGGLIGRIENMAVYESNNCFHIGGTLGTTGSQDVFIAGHKMGWSFAANVKETEAYRPPDKFGDAVKGLYLYGAKVVRPYALAAGYFQMPA
jgi:hypothetical protein